MGKNKLTPEQDIRTREFFESVVLRGKHLDGRLISELHGCIMDLLNYDHINDKYVERQVPARAYKWGEHYTTSCGPCEWAVDKERNQKLFKEELDEATHSVETSSSEPTEDTEVRKAVLPEDVQEVEGRG